jgi:hypothetical protein
MMVHQKVWLSGTLTAEPLVNAFRIFGQAYLDPMDA